MVSSTAQPPRAVEPVTESTIRRLTERGDVDGLLALLSDDEVMRSQALRRSILGSLHVWPDERASGALMRIAEEDPSRRTRRRAVGVLSAIGDRSTVPFLTKVLESSRDAGARVHAAHGLGNTRANEAVGPLLHALGDGNGMVRTAAASGLADIGDLAAVAPIESARRRTWNPLVRASLKLALDRLRRREA